MTRRRKTGKPTFSFVGGYVETKRKVAGGRTRTKRRFPSGASRTRVARAISRQR